ncbi:MAG: hypothetical protein ACON4R_04415 [Akkermansiaceae bacterium]
MRGIGWIWVFWLPVTLQAAISINWRSDLNAVNRQSDGVTPLDGSFEFMLGTFEGITPGVDNLEEWGAAFVPFGTATYSEASQRFSGSMTLFNNDSPFTVGSRAYLWGRNGTTSGSQWILIGKPSWTWPVANPVGPPPFPINWLVSTANGDDVILGSVEENGFHMQTASVEFPLTYEAWVAQEFQVAEDGSAEGDFDQDGRSNFLEYALGSDPKSADPDFTVILGQDLTIEVPRAAGRQVDWILQHSSDLTGFIDMEDGFERLVDEPERLVFKIDQTSDALRFFRVKAVPSG